MWYVYSRKVSTGREEFHGMYDTAGEAIKRIYELYSIDKSMKALGEYYYFMKEH